MRQPLWILGGGGHAKSVIDAAQSSGQFEVVGVLDDSWEGDGLSVSGVPVLGRIAESNIRRMGIMHAIIAIGSNTIRAAVAKRFDGIVSWVTVVHSAAYVAPSAQLGEGAVVCAGAIIQPEAEVHDHVIVNTGSSIGHDCILHDFTHVAPGVNLAGSSVVGTGAFLGIGSRVIPMKQVGEWATIGAGGVVISDIPSGVTAVGVPARIIKSPRYR